MMEKNAKIYVAGHRGMVGSAIVRALKNQRIYKYNNSYIKRIRFKKTNRCRRVFCERKTRLCIFSSS